MALSIKDEEIDRKVRRLAKLKNMSFTGAIRVAVDNELDREERSLRGRSEQDRWAELRRIQAMIREGGAIDYSLTEDEILGYDQDGIPTQ